ncbi:hypothetical protein BGZ58_000362 [Dissophora ornata]|nr:hypothetical protein BGZ58_000362 [Dissophora ornata]
MCSAKKDDVIQVLAQLESGWWAGYCQGRQGWFPSNYVEVLGEDDLESQDEDEEEYAEGDDLDVSVPPLTTYLFSVGAPLKTSFLYLDSNSYMGVPHVTRSG